MPRREYYVSTDPEEQVRFLADAMWQAINIARHPGFNAGRVDRMRIALEAGLKMTGLPLERADLPVPINDQYDGEGGDFEYPG